jgi:hypothetical protein
MTGLPSQESNTFLRITDLTVNLQDGLIYSNKPPHPSGRLEEGREPVNLYPY